MSNDPRLRLVAATPSREASDDALMLLVAHGDERAFAEIVGRHEAAVVRLCAAMLRRGPEAREVAQDTFLKLWTTRGRYQANGTFKAYLLAIARNACRRSSYRTRLASFFILQREPELELPTAEQVLVELERDRLIEAALARLPEKFRLPVHLRYVEGLDYDGIARVIGRTESAARSRVHYGLKALHALLPKEMLS